jgi:hypothetical protein
MAGLFGDQGQDHEAKIAVFQKAADAAFAMMTTVAAQVFAEVSAPAATAAMFMTIEKVSVHV